MSSKGDLLVGHKDTKVFPVDPHSGQPPVAAAGEGRVPPGVRVPAVPPRPNRTADDDGVDVGGSDRTPASPLFVGRTEYKVRALDGHTGRTQWDVSLGEYELYQASGGAASDLDPMEVLPFRDHARRDAATAKCFSRTSKGGGRTFCGAGKCRRRR